MFQKGGHSGISFCLEDKYSKCPLGVVTWRALVTLRDVRFIGVMGGNQIGGDRSMRHGEVEAVRVNNSTPL